MDGSVRLVDRPTPVHPVPRLARAIGLGPADLWLKRDDLGGLGGGGNKLRKLEVSMTEALAQGATTIVTTGAAQSNHARLTAAAGASLGLDVVLVLWGEEPEQRRGNLVLDELFGSRILWAGAGDAERLADETVAATAGAYRVPYGGSSAATAQAYVEAGREIIDQVDGVRHVVTAVGSGGTMAGLVRALGAERVLGVDTGALGDARGAVAALLEAMPGEPVPPSALRVEGGLVGAGYGRVHPAVREAVLLAGRSEGVVLDPVYTGRALAGLIAAVSAGDVRPGEPTVLVHTGGLPGLLGHPEW